MSESITGNAAHYFVDRHLDSTTADKAAFIESDGLKRSLSYRQLAEESGRMAALYAAQGIRSEERAAMLVLDQIEFPHHLLGQSEGGNRTHRGQHTAWPPMSTIRSFATAMPAYCLYRRPCCQLCKPILENHAHLRAIFVIGDSSEHLDFNAELARCEARPALPTNPDASAFWLYSSGSTGQPKGVRHIHSSLKFTADTYGEQVLQIKEDDVVYSAAKFFFAYGLGNAMTFPMSVGATTVLLSGRPTPDIVLDIINTHNPSVFCGVPTLYAALIAHLNGGHATLDTQLRQCISAR